MTLAYTIRGSEDGIIGVASSPAKAVAMAAGYVEQNGGTARDQDRDSTDLPMTVKILRKHDVQIVTIDNCPVRASACSGFAYAEIQKFDMNWSLGRDW